MQFRTRLMLLCCAALLCSGAALAATQPALTRMPLLLNNPPSEAPLAVTNPDAVLNPGPLTFPAGFMQSVKEYGAKGDGVTDDTAAIQAALDDERRNPDGSPRYTPPDAYNGRPRALYFPAGTYLVSKTLEWVGCCLTLQGQGPGSTIIRLKPNAPGFGDPTKPQPVIKTESGNMSFRQNIWDLTVSVAPGNPGAAGLDYISNNSGALRNVRIVSEDGSGVAGLSLLRAWPGPNLFKDVRIEGFDYGIRVQFIEYSQTYENIVLIGQRVAGIENNGAVMAIHGLYSRNRVPAILNNDGGNGLITLLSARLEGGAAGTSAIETASNKQAFLYLRDVTSTGYATVLRDNGTALPGTSVSEYYSGSKVYSLFNSAPQPQSLRLPIKNTPAFAETDPAKIGVVTCTGYFPSCAVAPQLRTLLSSGASTIVFPFGGRQVYDELTVSVPASVRRIVGYTGIINGGGSNGGGIKFVVEGDSPEPLIIEQFGYGVKVEQRGKRTVVLKFGIYDYTAQPGAGDLFAEDAQMDGFTLQPGQRVWARHINNEARERTKIINNGATLWLLGMKTEGQQTVIDTRGGGATEYLGGLIYPATDALQPGEIAFRVSGGSRVSLLYSNIVYTTRNYDIQVQETRGSTERRLLTSAAPERTRFYVSQ